MSLLTNSNGGWVKSTHSSGDGNCVEVQQTLSGVNVRDSKDRTGPVLSFTHAEWQAFVEGAVGGEFTLT